MRAFLVRHGAAETGGTGGDAGRRLTPEGRAAFERLARSVAPEVAGVRVLGSPYQRARDTAAILAAAIGAQVEEREELSSGGASGSVLLAIIEEEGGAVALVGHNPEIGEAIALAGGAGIAVPPGTIAAIEHEDGRWRLLWCRSP